MQIDKEKYFAIVRSQGLSAAISALHRDYGQLEYQSFEGDKGYQPQMWRDLDELREFSRELWNSLLTKNAPKL